MNYRHAFHAGNHADCLKHAVLVWLLQALARKPAGFLVLDTHAGPGPVDLEASPATRTGEWRDGIARLLAADPPALAAYLDRVRATPQRYPGSPALALALLRKQDRLIACELHPEDARTLRTRLAGDSRAAIHHRDGYAAIRAFLPPPERRALVLIDPPYEAPDDAERAAAALRQALARLPSAVVALWHPVKSRAAARALADGLRAAAIPDLIAAELLLRPPEDPAVLSGSALIVANPPYRFETELPPILHALRDAIAPETGSVSLHRLTDEHGTACVA
jgi:23S rRNA (adenine2030-N6)-methyltransferase